MMWLILGLACVIIDFFFIQSLVLLFFGLGALTTALALGYDLISNLEHQVIVFFVSATFWCLALWRPLKKLRRGKPYNNIIGQELKLLDTELLPGKQGFGEWSGTKVQIKLSNNSKPAKQGDLLTILKVDGITFTVSNTE